MIKNPTKDFTKLDSNFPLATLFFFFQFRTKFQLPPFRKNIHFSQDVKIFFFNLFSQLIYTRNASLVSPVIIIRVNYHVPYNIERTSHYS